VNRPDNAEHIPAPATPGEAEVFAGVLMHFVGGSKELRERLAKWMEHHEGDLDEQIVLWYLTACHELLQPDCEMPIGGDAHLGRTR
jgi:hypothetical protein